MSYSFNMRFIDLPQNENPDLVKLAAHEKANEFVRLLGKKENAFGFIDQNIWYLIDRYNASNPSIAYSILNHKLDELFTVRFVFWEQLGLLGIVGRTWPRALEKLIPFTHDFQNSTDQDYEFEGWSGISLFETIAFNMQHITRLSLARHCIQRGYSLESDFSNEDYIRKSICYDRIFEELDLKNWLYGREGTFQRITMNAIQTQEMHSDLLSYALSQINKEGLLKK